MGFTPTEIGQFTYREYAASCNAFARANGGGSRPEPPTDDEFEAMKRAHGDA